MHQVQSTEKEAVALPAYLDRNRILSVSQMAAGLNFSVAHLRRLYRTGKFPAPVRIGGRKLGWQAGILIDMTSGNHEAGKAL